MQNNMITVRNGVTILDPSIAEQIAHFERRMKFYKEQQEAVKAQILAEMENKGIKKIETPELAITYVAPTTREVFDGKTFKKENPEIYDAYVKISPVKSSVRIKVNE